MAEVRAERNFQAKFKADVRNRGIHKAVDNMEAANNRKRADEKRMGRNEQTAQMIDKYVGVHCGPRLSSKTIYHANGDVTRIEYVDGKPAHQTLTKYMETKHG